MNGHLEAMLAQHRELRALADSYRAELDRPTPDLAALGKCRWTLARLISAHLAYEGMHLYPALGRSGERGAALGVRLASEIGQLSTALDRHVREWTVATIEADWLDYRRKSKALIALFCARMDQEEADVYPLLRQARTA